MKKIVSLILSLSLATILAVPYAGAQNAAAVVDKVLAAMPAADASAFDAQMAALSAAAPATIPVLAGMLKPAAQGVKNNLVEYALTGLPAYVGKHPEVLDKVSQGFADAIGKAGNAEVKAFLMERLRLIATDKVADVFAAQVSDPAVAQLALGTLTDLPGSDNILLDLVKNAGADKTLLAAAAARKGLTAAEPYLQEWASAAEGYESDALCDALAGIGTASSLDILSKKSLPALAALAVKLSGEGKNSKAVAKAAKTLLASETSAFKSAGAQALMQNNPALVLKTLKKVLGSEDGQLRDAVLDDATQILGANALVPMLTGKFGKLSEGAQVDVLNWLGNNKISSAAGLLAGVLNGTGKKAASLSNAVKVAAIAAAGKIGGESLGKVLLGQLGSSDDALSSAALTALKSFKGDLSGDLVSALQAAQNPNALLQLASSRKIAAVAPALLSRLQGGDLSAAPYLAGVVGEGDIPAVAALLAGAKDHVGDLQNALVSALHTLTPDKQFETLFKLDANKPAQPNFFPVFAGIGTEQAADYLGGMLNDKSADVSKAALESLLGMDSGFAFNPLYPAAKADPSLRTKILPRLVDLVVKNEPKPATKQRLFSEFLGLSDAKEVKAKVLGALGGVPTMKSFLLASKYLDDKEVAYPAANAVKAIAAKCTEEIDAAAYIAALKKAAGVFSSTGNPDDGYAVSEINTLLEKAPAPVAPSTLTAQEKKQGFEMLFDGTSLDRWQGDKESYTPVNGAILVSSNGTGTGNLYTDKEYRNFVFRFEFCFLREGVNNGVGIRTPMGVDAAYYGMCECQILDHDAPEYADWLREYQVHGSVYGVVPAKRLVHKPLGEWSTEEIRVEGDHIKVTVNGQVIVDANIRKACKGHNVAPDGSNENPYTVDHRNHPGMFNKKGYVSFCGHGEGLKIRNVRILDLGDKK